MSKRGVTGKNTSMDSQKWQPSNDELIESIKKTSSQRRSNPAGFVTEFAETYMADSTPEELDAQWAKTVSEYPWYAEDYLECLHLVLADKSTPLPQLIVDIALIDSPDNVSGSQAEDVARRWLSDIHRRFSKVFEELSTDE